MLIFALIPSLQPNQSHMPELQLSFYVMQAYELSLDIVESGYGPPQIHE
jgi:hypothetical protein